MKVRIALFAVILCLTAGFAGYAWPQERGESAIAERYLLWAENAITAGQWPQARAALERATDFVSSDILYLLAVVYAHQNESRFMSLQALEKAIGIGQWNRYTEAQARLLEAEKLVTLRRFPEALDSLAAYRAVSGDDADSAMLSLAALKGLNEVSSAGNTQFLRLMRETMDRYPRDPRSLRILFSYALDLKYYGQLPGRDERELLEIALRRVPFLLAADPDLAWMAAHFIGDDDEARRLVAAYRNAVTDGNGSFRPNPASLVPALNLGLVDDMGAIEELFSNDVIDKDIVIDIGNLLRSDEGWDRLAEKLHSFTGTITEDSDRDGYPESRAVYRQGSLQEYCCDVYQDGTVSLFMVFIADEPQYMVLPPVRAHASVSWERYPAVQKATLGAESFQFAPRAFHFDPINFIELGASGTYKGLLFPQRDPLNPELNRRILASFAFWVQRPCAEFDGGVEQIYLERGMPVRAETRVHGALVSVTEFEKGSPVIQRLDKDFDGRMETVRRFHAPSGQAAVKSSESDWSGDGSFSTAELYPKDGSVVYLWDLDGDGEFDHGSTR